MPDNNLQEGIFESPLMLPELKTLDLSGNNLYDINFTSLYGLSKLNSLHVEGNNLVFRHIIAAFSSDAYSGFSADFTYSPQAKIDFAQDIELNPGDILEMEIDSFFISDGDQIQWYKDVIPLSGETNNYYDKTVITINDSGNYYVEVTNPNVPNLRLTSNIKNVTVNDFVGGVPRKEYEALVALYNAMNGDNWNIKTNWLDTLNRSIGDWYGITIENGHVIQINLFTNNLKGELPEEIGNLGELQWLNLQNNDIRGEIPYEFFNLTKLTTLIFSFNRISGLLDPEIGQLSNLKYFYIDHNTIEGPLPIELKNLKMLEVFHINANQIGRIIDENTVRESRQIPDALQGLTSLWSFQISQNYLLFNDIEPIFSWHNYSNLTQFKYELQTGLHDVAELKSEKGEKVRVSIPNYLPSLSDSFCWYKDGIAIEGSNDSVLILENVQLNDEGFYYCSISNSIATGVNIVVHAATLFVNDIHGAGVPLFEYNALVNFYTSNNGEHWKNKKNWLDTINVTVNDWEGVMVYNGHVTEISMDTNNVSGTFPKSLYKLRNLERLGFFMNNLSGNLPDDIDSLSNLQGLFLMDI